MLKVKGVDLRALLPQCLLMATPIG